MFVCQVDGCFSLVERKCVFLCVQHVHVCLRECERDPCVSIINREAYLEAVGGSQHGAFDGLKYASGLNGSRVLSKGNKNYLCSKVRERCKKLFNALGKT